MAVTMGRVFERAEDRQKQLMELADIGFELLMNCRARKQIGPPQLRGLPPAPTVIEQTLWLLWLAQGSGWLVAEYFGGYQDKEDGG